MPRLSLERDAVHRHDLAPHSLHVTASCPPQNHLGKCNKSLQKFRRHQLPSLPHQIGEHLGIPSTRGNEHFRAVGLSVAIGLSSHTCSEICNRKVAPLETGYQVSCMVHKCQKPRLHSGSQSRELQFAYLRQRSVSLSSGYSWQIKIEPLGTRKPLGINLKSE